MKLKSRYIVLDNKHLTTPNQQTTFYLARL